MREGQTQSAAIGATSSGAGTRPTDRTANVKALMLRGKRLLIAGQMSHERIADSLGVHLSTVYGWAQELSKPNDPNSLQSQISELRERIRTLEAAVATLQGLPSDPIIGRRILQKIGSK